MFHRFLIIVLAISLAPAAISQLPFRARHIASAVAFSGASSPLLGRRSFAVADRDGDGVRDFMVEGDDYMGSYGLETGLSAIYSTMTGSFIQGFVGDCDPFDDLDGDGIDDLVISDGRAAYYPQPALGSVSILSGADGSTLRTHVGVGVYPSSASTNIGRFAATIGDVDLDGFRDYSYSEYDYGSGTLSAFVRSGATGLLLNTIPISATIFDPTLGATLTSSRLDVAAIGDVNADGRADLVLYDQQLTNPAGGYLCGYALISAWDGALLQSRLLPYGSGSVADLAAAGDLDLDGCDDFYVALRNSGTIETMSGANGAVIHSFTDAGFCGGIDSGDVDGDGVRDLVAGWFPPASVGGVLQAGSVRLYSGYSQQLIQVVNGILPLESLGASVHLAGDMDGDGCADILASTAEPPLTYFPYTADRGWRVLSPFGAATYGAAGGAVPLQLTWTSSVSPVPSLGVLSCLGASPFALGVVAVSLSPAQSSISGLPLLVATDPINLLPLEYFGFDNSGSLIAAVAIKSPILGGTNFFLQAFQTYPVLGASNGLDLLFTN